MVDQSGKNTSLLASLSRGDIVDHMYVPEAILFSRMCSFVGHKVCVFHSQLYKKIGM